MNQKKKRVSRIVCLSLIKKNVIKAQEFGNSSGMVYIELSKLEASMTES